MEIHFAMMADVTQRSPDQQARDSHAQDPVSFRPDAEEYDAAKAILDARGQVMTAYLRACLRWLDHDPDTALATLAPLWPDPRPTGRPRRRARGTPGGGQEE
jgi:hypothetical protein